MEKTILTLKGDLFIIADNVPVYELLMVGEMLNSVQNTFASRPELDVISIDEPVRIPIFSECEDKEQFESVLDSIEDLINTQLEVVRPKEEFKLVFDLSLKSGDKIQKAIIFKEKDSVKTPEEIDEALKLNKDVIYPAKSDDTSDVLELHISGPAINEDGTPYISITSPDNSILSVSVVDINTGEIKLNRIFTKTKLERIREYKVKVEYLGHNEFTDYDYYKECVFWVNTTLCLLVPKEAKA